MYKESSHLVSPPRSTTCPFLLLPWIMPDVGVDKYACVQVQVIQKQVLKWSLGYKTFTCKRKKKRKGNWAEREVQLVFTLDEVLANTSGSFGEKLLFKLCPLEPRWPGLCMFSSLVTRCELPLTGHDLSPSVAETNRRSWHLKAICWPHSLQLVDHEGGLISMSACAQHLFGLRLNLRPSPTKYL